MAEKITKRLQVIGSFGVPTPESAEIGHYFKVKTVDDAGKVTETEAIDLDTDIQTLKDNVADLMYEPIDITSFTNSNAVVELGSTIESTTLTWALSRSPSKLTLDGKKIDVTSTSATDTTGYTVNKTWALVATDDKGNTDSAHTSVIFTNASYYGVLEDGATIDSDTILGLTKVLQSSKNLTFTQTAGSTQCIVYAAPSRYETPSFSMNELDGGFYLDSTISFTNSSGYTENYDIWMTESLGVGEVTTKVTYASEVGLQFDGGYVDESGYMHLTYGGVDIEGFVPFYVGGSGSGSGSGTAATYTITLSNLSESRTITKPAGETVVLSLNYTSVDDEGMDDGPGLGTILVEGIARDTFSVPQGSFDVDVTEYLANGTNNVTIKVTNSENNSRSVPYTITIAALSLTSSFDAASAYSGDILFAYTPVGLAEKTVYFELDGTVIDTATVTTSGRQQSFTIPTQTHGAHIFRCWFTCVVSGVTVSSNVLYYSIICTVDGDTTPIIAVTSPPLTGIAQYSNIVTKYRVYDPSSLTAAITLEANGATVSSLTVDRTEQSWTYQPTVVGELELTIRCGDVHVSWTQTVIESSIQVEVESEALALYLSSYGRSNNEANPGVWESNGVSAEFSNFNFVSDGWVSDDEDITVLRVTGDARLTIPYKMFAYDFRTTGKTLEFELATREVLDYSAEVLTCWSGERGFKITAQELSMKSEQSSLGTRYKEDEHIHICIVAEKKTENRLLEFYINGILSGAVQYPEDDDFSQATPVGITIGSNDCTTDIYNIRAYDNSLTRYQTIENWIADTRDTDERNARYKRNDIYDVYGQVVISKLPTDLPYMVIQGAESPQYKGDKKTVTGYYTDPLHPELSYSFVATQIDVQGTSSQYYYRKNYKLKYKKGFIMYDGTTVNDYQMNENAVPTDTFTMKADVASSEGAFNVVLSMLYNDLCPYKTPAQQEDSRIRQCIEGFPCVIFWDYGDGPVFLGKYNFNNDKGTDEVFGFKEGDESWEIRQNGTDRVGWHSADFSDSSWTNDFEARYPEDNTDTTRLQALAEWLVSTDTDQATNETLDTAVTYNDVEYTTDSVEYRLAKFSAELSNHFIEEAIIFYYLYTEIFLSIDQREKNAFPTYLVDEDRWIVLFYDADSSCGTDNKGNLAFEYYLEDIDYTEGGDPIYNGQNSVLWKNLRATRYDEITAMYQDLRTSNAISYEFTIDKFMTHQGKWPEAIFNEDMYTKCIEPLINDGDGLYLPMLQGKKEQWMKWWLYNRFRYLDSKYITGTSMENRITMRTHAQANISLMAYVNMYGHVYYNAEMVEHRMERNKEYEFVWAASGAEDAVIGINDADMLTSLGDLAPLMVELIDASKATHITSLKIGDAAEDYTNYSLNTITLGNNVLLRTLDVRNCPNMTQSVDISGCTNIEEVYFDGTAIPGLKLPDGGILKTLHLPSTMVNLTVINQPQLADFVLPSYSQITTLRVENAGVLDGLTLDILNEMADGSRVRIIGMNLECTADEALVMCDRLDAMRGLDESGNTVTTAQVSGTIYIPSLTSEILYRIRSKYPSITVLYDELIRYTVNFYNGSTLLQTVENVDYLGSAEYTGDTPIKDGETDHSRWSFIGWDPSPDAVIGDTDCYAQYEFVGSYARELIARTLSGEYTNDRVTSVGARAFSYCTSLTDLNLPNVTSLGSDFIANCYDSKGGIIASHVNVRLDSEISFAWECRAFSYLSAGTIIDFRNYVSLGYRTAYGGTTYYCHIVLRYTDGVCPLTHPQSYWERSYFYVPSALLADYQAATNWSSQTGLGNTFRAIEDYTVDGTLTGELDETKI